MRSIPVALLLLLPARADADHHGSTTEVAGGVVTRFDSIGIAARGGVGWYAQDRLALGGSAELFLGDGTASARLVLGPSLQLWIHDRVFASVGGGYVHIVARNRETSLRGFDTYGGGVRTGVRFGSLTLALAASYTPSFEVDACVDDNVGGVIVAALVGYQRR